MKLFAIMRRLALLAQEPNAGEVDSARMMNWISAGGTGYRVGVGEASDRVREG